MTIEKIEDTIEAWETGALGRDARYTVALPPEDQASDEAAINAAFQLQPISIRMEVEILDQLKAIAKHRGLGYQPLIRQVLHRWVDNELKQIALESLDQGEYREVKLMPKAA